MIESREVPAEEAAFRVYGSLWMRFGGDWREVPLTLGPPPRPPAKVIGLALPQRSRDEHE